MVWVSAVLSQTRSFNNILERRAKMIELSSGFFLAWTIVMFVIGAGATGGVAALINRIKNR